jgi:iron uptake system component EfeO
MATRGGDVVDDKVAAAFARLETVYAAVPGDALPRPNANWSSLAPSVADKGTSFGRLFTLVEHETDPEKAGSLVASLGAVAEKLELPAALLR